MAPLFPLTPTQQMVADATDEERAMAAQQLTSEVVAEAIVQRTAPAAAYRHQRRQHLAALASLMPPPPEGPEPPPTPQTTEYPDGLVASVKYPELPPDHFANVNTRWPSTVPWGERIAGNRATTVDDWMSVLHWYAAGTASRIRPGKMASLRECCSWQGIDASGWHYRAKIHGHLTALREEAEAARARLLSEEVVEMAEDESGDLVWFEDKGSLRPIGNQQAVKRTQLAVAVKERELARLDRERYGLKPIELRHKHLHAVANIDESLTSRLELKDLLDLPMDTLIGRHRAALAAPIDQSGTGA